MMAEATRRAPSRILFVCIGNSCRSQMAEALANKLGAGQVRVWSAGSMPLGEIIRPIYQVMKEKDLTLEGQWSKGVNDVPLAEMDVVVSMGGEVRYSLPSGFKGIRVQWNIPDPFGHDLGYFRSVRDLIERQVKSLLRDLEDRRQSSIEELLEAGAEGEKGAGKNLKPKR